MWAEAETKKQQKVKRQKLNFECEQIWSLSLEY